MKMNDICISKDETVIGAMARLDELATKILFVCEDGKLLAALTDGDIRRWILSSGALDAPVEKVANYNPLFIRENDNVDVVRFLHRKRIEAVPIVDSENRIKDVVFRDEEGNRSLRGHLKNTPVVIMAGGKGTRLYPYTKILPKPLIPVGEIPIAERIVNDYRSYGCSDFYMIVNHKKNMIKAYFNETEKDYALTFIDEEKPLGTGGGLSLLKGRVKDTFVLTNCDILIRNDISKIYKHHKKKGHVITMVCSLKNFRIPYGVVEIDSQGEIGELKEKPELSFFTNTGCYIVEPEVIDELKDNEPIDFPTVIDNYRKQGRSVGVYPIGEKEWLDMGQMDELERMRSMLEEG